jgi:hypothetical protein
MARISAPNYEAWPVEVVFFALLSLMMLARDWRGIEQD